MGHRRGTGRHRGVAVSGPSSGFRRCLDPQPQPVSCVPLYHPGQRDFPSPVGNEGISSWSLPPSPATQAMARIRRMWLGLLLVSSGRCSPGFAGSVSHPFAPDRTAFAQGPFAPEALPSFSATTGPCAGPRASRLPFSDCLMGGVLAACATHSWSRGPSRFWSALLS